MIEKPDTRPEPHIHRQRSTKWTAAQRLAQAQKLSLAQRPPAHVTLPRAPWEAAQ